LRQCKTHPTAEELYRLVKPHTPRLSLATVYNTLDALCHAGLCRKLPTTAGCCRFDADTSDHVHVKFRDTGEICDVPADIGELMLSALPRHLLEQIEKHVGASIDGVSIQLAARRAAQRS
jgi:Fe2+ or Zn2+ uptake regulation protein